MRMIRLSIGRWCCAVLLLFCLPAVSFAQRELHWDALEVTAHLNSNGSLAVVEDHKMVFTGAWNGGERSFDIRPRQTLAFHGMSRWTGATWQSMTESAGLRDVDDFAFTAPKTLRWRSRLPSDPPYDNSPLRYQLRYALSGILLSDGTSYTLDHDFAFPKRDGIINRYELRLTLDPAWQPTGDAVRDIYTADMLAPGQRFVLTIPLRYVGAGTPHALDSSRPLAIKLAALSIIALTLVSIVWLFLSETAKGRFAPFDLSGIDEAWLREHILKYPAELVSAAWDDQIGQSEVVTLVARMASDKKLESQVSGTGGQSGMTLRLLVARTRLTGYERALVDKLFYGDRTTTSTADVKAHYKTTGFNPVDVIKSGLEKQLKETLPFADAPRRYRVETFALILGAFSVLVPGCVSGDLNGAMVVLLVVCGLVAAGLASIPGVVFRRHMEWGYVAAVLCLLAPCAVATGAVAFLWFYPGTGAMDFSTATTIGTAALALASTTAGINALRSRQQREGVVFRKQFTAGRLFFKSELGKPAPALRDEWFPWVLAFNLGSRIDDWSARFAGVDASTIATSSSSSSRSSSTSSSSWTGFGGGHSGGAGASASWAMAAGGLAAGVAAPGSSGSGGSSGGGGGGGGSSGGGGGGGW
jgi:uncharacterized membrane protein YgcG